MGVGTQRYVRQELAKGNAQVFLYCFTHFNAAAARILKLFWPHGGATHCNELVYLFRAFVVSRFELTEEDRQVVALTTRLFASFCRYGDPNAYNASAPMANVAEPDWPPCSPDLPGRCLLLQPHLRTEQLFLEGRPDAWLRPLKEQESTNDSSTD